MSNNYTETELQLILNKITSAQASTITMNDGELYLAPDTAVYSVNNVTPVNGNVSIPEGANKDLSNLSSTGNSKFQAPITGGASTITSSNLTTNRALISNSSGKVAVSSVTLSELGYVSGATSNIQTQLNNKVASNSAITGATKCKITYDSKGLVTSGADLTASDIPDISSTYYLASNPNGYTSNVGTVTDVQINGTSIISSNVANIVTNTAYNASSNKIATMSDLPTGLPSQTSQSGKYLTTDGSSASWASISIPTVDQTYNSSSSNAQSGVAIAGAGFLTNTATGTNSLTIEGTATSKKYCTNIGIGSGIVDNGTNSGIQEVTILGRNATLTVNGTGNTLKGGIIIGDDASVTLSGTDEAYLCPIVIGNGASVTASEGVRKCIAIGQSASVTADSAIQIGRGTNSTAQSLQIGFGSSSSDNYQLLDGTTGLIPDARISSNIARTSAIPTVPTNISAFTNDSGYITGITSSDVTTALGYTPYNSSNPNGYTSNVGTVTSVNNTSPDANGNVVVPVTSVVWRTYS